jgi:hypothetical protein
VHGVQCASEFTSERRLADAGKSAEHDEHAKSLSNLSTR